MEKRCKCPSFILVSFLIFRAKYLTAHCTSLGSSSSVCLNKEFFYFHLWYSPTITITFQKYPLLLCIFLVLSMLLTIYAITYLKTWQNYEMGKKIPTSHSRCHLHYEILGFLSSKYLYDLPFFSPLQPHMRVQTLMSELPEQNSTH